jgi:hypothetical protein
VRPISFIELLAELWKFSKQSQRGTRQLQHSCVSSGRHSHRSIALDTSEHRHLSKTRTGLNRSDFSSLAVQLADIDIKVTGNRDIESVASPLALFHDRLAAFKIQQAHVWTNPLAVAIVASLRNDFEVSSILQFSVLFEEKF